MAEENNKNDLYNSQEEVDLIEEYIDDIGYFYEDEYEKYEQKKRHNVFLNCRNIVVSLVAFVIGITLIGAVQTSQYKDLNGKIQIVDSEAIKVKTFFDNTEKAFKYLVNIKGKINQIGSNDSNRISGLLTEHHKTAYNNYSYLLGITSDENYKKYIPNAQNHESVTTPRTYALALKNAYENILLDFFNYENYDLSLTVFQESQPTRTEVDGSNYSQEALNYINYTYEEDISNLRSLKVASENSVIK